MRTKLVLLIAFGAMLGAACGGGSGSSSSNAPSQTTTTTNPAVKSSRPGACAQARPRVVRLSCGMDIRASLGAKDRRGGRKTQRVPPHTGHEAHSERGER